MRVIQSPEHTPTVHQTQIDGVRVLWAPCAGPLEASLIFGAGVCDETLVTCGITHLLEHLVMWTPSRRRYPHNATVGPDITEFTAVGSPETIVAFLHDICTALSDPPVQHLEREIGVLQTEGGGACSPTMAEHLGVRYGTVGPGLLSMAPPALHQLDPRDLKQHAETYFTTDNAVLILTGPVPPALRLPLPTRQGPDPRPAPNIRPVALPLPGWFAPESRGLSLSFLAPARSAGEREALLTALRVVTDRATSELRLNLGWVYSIDFELTLAGDDALVVITADPLPEQAHRVCAGLLRILREVAEGGPSADELEADFEEFCAVYSNPLEIAARLHSMACDLVQRGAALQPTERLDTRRAVSAQDCQRALALLEATLLVAASKGVEPARLGLQEAEPLPAQPVTGRRYRRTWIKGPLYGLPLRCSVVVGEQGVTWDVPGQRATVLWSDLVMLEERPELNACMVIGADGTFFPIVRSGFRRSRELLNTIYAYVPSNLRVFPPA